MKPKTICIVVQNYYDIDPRVRREADALVQAGFHVDVLALHPLTRTETHYSINNVCVYTLPLGKKRGGKWSYIAEYLIFFTLAFFWLASHTIRDRYDIVQVCTLPDFLVFSALVPKLFGTKIVLDMHEVMPEFYISKFGVLEDNWIIRLIRIQEKLSTKFADLVLTVNDPVKSILVKRGLPESKIIAIMNLPDESVFTNNYEAHWPRSAPPKFELIYTGTLGERHGVQTAILGLPDLVDHIPGIHLTLIGDGDYKGELINLVESLNLKNYVSFLTPVPLDQIPQYLHNSDMGICLQQGSFCDIAFPTKVPEYIMTALPVIVTENTITNTYFDSNMVFFIPPNDPASFVERVRESYNNPAFTRSIINNAQKFTQVYNWSGEKQKYIQAIRGLI